MIAKKVDHRRAGNSAAEAIFDPASDPVHELPVGVDPLIDAARLVETHAYDLAGEQSTALVAELILLSARLVAVQRIVESRRRTGGK